MFVLFSGYTYWNILILIFLLTFIQKTIKTKIKLDGLFSN